MVVRKFPADQQLFAVRRSNTPPARVCPMQQAKLEKFCLRGAEQCQARLPGRFFRGPGQ